VGVHFRIEQRQINNSAGRRICNWQERVHAVGFASLFDAPQTDDRGCHFVELTSLGRVGLHSAPVAMPLRMLLYGWPAMQRPVATHTSCITFACFFGRPRASISGGGEHTRCCSQPVRSRVRLRRILRSNRRETVCSRRAMCARVVCRMHAAVSLCSGNSRWHLPSPSAWSRGAAGCAEFAWTAWTPTDEDD
jgi:hypothetical protein